MLLHEIVEREARIDPSRVAVVFGDVPVTYGELSAQVDALAAALISNAPAGSRVAVIADNCVEYLVAYYGVPKAGMVMTVLNQRLHPSEQAWILRDVAPTVVIGRGRYLEELRAAGPKVAAVRRWVGIDSGGDILLSDFTADRAGDSDSPVVHPDDTAWIIYTSGTTGRPKGAMLSHRALMQTMQSTILEFDIRRGDSFLFPFPMCHIGGYLLTAHHLVGGSVLLESRFTAREWLQLVESARPTTSALAPTMISMILSSPELDRRDISSLRWILYGASSIPAAVLVDAVNRLGTDLQQGYGGTEMGGFICVLDAQSHREAVRDKPELLTSAGRPMSFIDLRVVDRHMADVGIGEVGEVVVRGDQVMTGYWHNDEATEQVVRGGWVHTGDLACVDDNRNVHIVDRMHDMIVTGAENVYPREVEEVLYRHPAVAEAAVFSVPDEQWVDAVAAAVAVRPGHDVTAEELIEHCRRNLASYKKPRRIAFLDELPKNATGKILRREVRAAAMAAQSLAANSGRPPEISHRRTVTPSSDGTAR